MLAKVSRISGFAVFAVVSVTALPAAAQDTSAGEKLFKRCAACHSLEAGRNKTGPSLAGLFGRKPGTVESFKYSKAMRAADFVWSPETLDRYLAAPKAFVPGNRMPFPGLKKAEDRAALNAYLETTPARP